MLPTVLNGKVLFAIFAIDHNVPMSISYGKGTQYNMRCPSYLFFATEASFVPHMSDIVKLKKHHAVLLGIEQEMDRFLFYYR